MASITIDGLDEEIFRRNIEGMLRVGEADRAALKLRALLEPFAGEGRILPARFLEVTAADFRLEGWEYLGECLARNDLPRNPISALTIAVSDAEAMGLDAAEAGDAVPLIATSHFTDEAYMFSQCGVSDLLDGYSFYGCEWHGSSTHMDTALTLGGVDDLYRAVARIEAELIASPQPAVDMIRAGSLASCFLAVLLHQAVRDTIRARGLPRPLCVMAGNEGVYPYFDAPVIGTAECTQQGLVIGGGAAPDAVAPAPVLAAQDMDETGQAAETAAEGGVAYGRLDELTGRKHDKKMVLELVEADVRSAAELLDRAGVERMGEERMVGEATGGDDGLAPAGLLAHRGPSHPLFPVDRSAAAPFDPPPGHGDPDDPFAGHEPLPAGVDPFASPGSFPELAEAGAWPVASGRPEAEPADFSQPSGPGLREFTPECAEPQVAEPQSPVLEPTGTDAPEPVRALPSHSLRARFADASSPPPPPPSLWSAAGAAILRWLHAVFG